MGGIEAVTGDPVLATSLRTVDDSWLSSEAPDVTGTDSSFSAVSVGVIGRGTVVALSSGVLECPEGSFVLFSERKRSH